MTPTINGQPIPCCEPHCERDATWSEFRPMGESGLPVCWHLCDEHAGAKWLVVRHWDENV